MKAEPEIGQGKKIIKPLHQETPFNLFSIIFRCVDQVLSFQVYCKYELHGGASEPRKFMSVMVRIAYSLLYCEI